MIYEVAEAGGLGTVKQVEVNKLYDFLHYLSYIRAKGKLNRIISKRSEQNSRKKQGGNRGSKSR